ncbi:MAG: hypothetical protein IKZ17_01340 [Bacteroidaceae bacterium]|nr:hypothetical protein [Bacteroidaceae bacterium]
MNRKPAFIRFGNLGPCVVYPVSIHVGGRTWEEKEILVPVQAWRDGKRKFGFYEGYGVTVDQYAVSEKVEKSVARAVVACLRFFQIGNEIRQLMARIHDLESMTHAMGEEYDFEQGGW